MTIYSIFHQCFFFFFLTMPDGNLNSAIKSSFLSRKEKEQDLEAEGLLLERKICCRISFISYWCYLSSLGYRLPFTGHLGAFSRGQVFSFITCSCFSRPLKVPPPPRLFAVHNRSIEAKVSSVSP